MNKTKQTIMTNAILLFNDKGLSNVSLRDIADKMGISIGNLQYHFKKRELLVEAIYDDLVDTLNEKILSHNQQSDNVLVDFLAFPEMMFTVFFEYRFFFLDFTHIIRTHKHIQQHFQQLMLNRKAEFMHIVNMLNEKGYIRAEELSNEYEGLYSRIEILSNFFLSSLVLANNTLDQTQIKQSTKLIQQSIYPYLTENGKAVYLSNFK